MGRAAKKIDWDKAQEILKSLEEKKDYRGLMAVALGTMTAYRCSDWQKLKWQDITDAIRIREQKTGKMREVAVHPELNRIVSLCRGAPEDYIFLPLRGGTGKPLATGGAIKLLRKIGQDHGIDDLSSHSLRKCFSWRVYEMGGKTEHSLIQLSMLLNHRSLSDTYRYLGLTQESFNEIYLSL